MVAGYERINERTKQPNKLIAFIKPLESSDKAIAQDILERVAAIVYPVMKNNYLGVTSLEEFPPNREFWGRNFNHGEVIQLVLKSPHTGQWLPMQMIESVMLHELAHCKEMNHSRNFHKLRLTFVAELSTLKSRGYTGEGLWGKGRALHPSVDLTGNRQVPEDELPQELCGGTFRKEKKRRKTKEKGVISYAERKQRRIEKKFGTSAGEVVGTDEEERVKLEGGRKVKGKPRVAGSARARELRAAAALKRFGEQPKIEETETKITNIYDSDETTSGDEKEVKVEEMVKVEDEEGDKTALWKEFEELQACAKPTEATDPTLKRVTLHETRAKVENEKDKGKMQEVVQLDSDVTTSEGEIPVPDPEKMTKAPLLEAQRKPRELFFNASTKLPVPNLRPSLLGQRSPSFTRLTSPPTPEISNPTSNIPSPKETKSEVLTPYLHAHPHIQTIETATVQTAGLANRHRAEVAAVTAEPTERVCTVCSTPNPGVATICLVCANVLVETIEYWRCSSAVCRSGDGQYRNSGDFNLCGVCGQRRT